MKYLINMKQNMHSKIGTNSKSSLYLVTKLSLTPASKTSLVTIYLSPQVATNKPPEMNPKPKPEHLAPAISNPCLVSIASMIQKQDTHQSDRQLRMMSLIRNNLLCRTLINICSSNPSFPIT